VFNARFEPYEPAHHLKIVNILGMEEEARSPARWYSGRMAASGRLDTVLETPGDSELFIMFADRTSGHETYGAGRFLYIPLPRARRRRWISTKAFNRRAR